MELIFIRHGEPAWSLDGVSQRDPQLTARGREQASLAAHRLADGSRRPTELLVSPSSRAQQTATVIAAVIGVPPTTVDDLEEIRTPDWEGELEERVQRIFKQARARPPEQWWEGLLGGESFHDFHDRVSRVMRSILTERGVTPSQNRHLWDVADGDSTVAVVAHAGTNSTALSFLLGIEPTPWEWERFILGHASLARVRTVPLGGSHVFSLRAFNDRDHLPLALRTR